jgi:hypothetical protein
MSGPGLMTMIRTPGNSTGCVIISAYQAPEEEKTAQVYLLFLLFFYEVIKNHTDDNPGQGIENKQAKKV